MKNEVNLFNDLKDSDIYNLPNNFEIKLNQNDSEILIIANEYCNDKKYKIPFFNIIRKEINESDLHIMDSTINNFINEESKLKNVLEDLNINIEKINIQSFYKSDGSVFAIDEIIHNLSLLSSNNFKSFVKIDCGIMKIIDKSNENNIPSILEIDFDNETHSKLEKLIGKKYNLSNYGVKMVDYGCSKDGELYSITNFNEDSEDYENFELLEYCYHKNGYSETNLNQLKDLENQDVNDIANYFVNVAEDNFSDEDLEVLDNIVLSSDEEEFYSDIDSVLHFNGVDEFLFEKHRILFGYDSPMWGPEIVILNKMNNNELVNSDEKDKISYWINGDFYKSEEDSFDFSRDGSTEFDNLYKNHYKKVILKVLNAIFKQENL